MTPARAMREVDPEYGFAGVYDLIYDGPAGYYAAQLACLRAYFEQGRPGPQCLLEAGCGPGRQLTALAARGHRVVGLDASRAMLGKAHTRLAAAGLPSRLLHADLRALPCSDAEFDGAYCLESPLAYLIHEEELDAALAGLSRVLRPGGLLMVDILDYPSTIGTDGTPRQTHDFPISGGKITVRESHTPDWSAGTWCMRQEFLVYGREMVTGFAVDHVFSLRSAEGYCAAIEAAGFLIAEILDRYPGSPHEVAHEVRTIILAVKRA